MVSERQIDAGAPGDDELLDAARAAARKAADLQQEARGRWDPSAWSEKGQSDFVTEVDLESERLVVSTLLERFPEHRILAEEGSIDGGDAARGPIRWIIDPLDGTTNWMHGYPEHAVSIGAEDGEGIRVALVLNSANGERFEAVRGGGALLDGRPIHVSEVSELRYALVGTGFPFKALHVLPAYLEVFSRVLRSTAGIRRAGSAALDLCSLACGRLDAFWEYWLMPWDVAAGSLIVREAGGVFEPMEVPGIDGSEVSAGLGGGMPEGLAPGPFLGANARLVDGFRRLVRGDLPR